MKKSAVKIPSDHLGLAWGRKFAVCNWLEIYWNGYTLGTEANAKELGGVIILVIYLKFLGLWS